MQRFIEIIMVVMILSLNLPAAHAEAIGNFTQIVGQVQLFKHGKETPLIVKEQDVVEPKDIIVTKSQGKAEVKFLDESTIIIAPESRVSMEEFSCNLQKSQRHAMLRLFQGVIHTTVSKIFNNKEPDFVMKTVDVVMGVRGTKWFTIKGKNFTDVHNESGQLSLKYWLRGVEHEIFLEAMHSFRRMAGQLAGPPTPLNMKELIFLRRLIQTGMKFEQSPHSNPHTLLEKLLLQAERRILEEHSGEMKKKGGDSDPEQATTNPQEDDYVPNPNLSSSILGSTNLGGGGQPVTQGSNQGEIIASPSK